MKCCEAWAIFTNCHESRGSGRVGGPGVGRNVLDGPISDDTGSAGSGIASLVAFRREFRSQRSRLDTRDAAASAVPLLECEFIRALAAHLASRAKNCRARSIRPA